MKQIVYDLKTKETKIIELPDPTEEEILEMQKAQEEFEKAEAMRQPTVEERLEAMETAFMEFVEVMING